MGTLGRNSLSFLTHFSLVFFFYIPPVNVRKLRFSSVSRGYKMGTLGINGLNYKLFILIFTKFKNNFFRGATTFSNCFWIFK